jgi:hypothetical protein
MKKFFEERGKRLYNHSPGLFDSVKFDYKDYYVSPNDRINQILDYYSVLDKQRGRSLDNIKSDNYSKLNEKQINLNLINQLKNRNKQTNLSPDNPHNNSVDSTSPKKDEYYVMKFNHNAVSSIEYILRKNQKKIKIINKK